MLVFRDHRAIFIWSWHFLLFALYSYLTCSVVFPFASRPSHVRIQLSSLLMLRACATSASSIGSLSKPGDLNSFEEPQVSMVEGHYRVIARRMVSANLQRMRNTTMLGKGKALAVFRTDKAPWRQSKLHLQRTRPQEIKPASNIQSVIESPKEPEVNTMRYTELIASINHIDTPSVLNHTPLPSRHTPLRPSNLKLSNVKPASSHDDSRNRCSAGPETRVAEIPPAMAYTLIHGPSVAEPVSWRVRYFLLFAFTYGRSTDPVT